MADQGVTNVLIEVFSNEALPKQSIEFLRDFLKTANEENLQESLYMNVQANNLEHVKLILENKNPRADVNFKYKNRAPLLEIHNISDKMRALLESGITSSPTPKQKFGKGN